jgi:iron complex transport system substrate-binding protein
MAARSTGLIGLTAAALLAALATGLEAGGGGQAATAARTPVRTPVRIVSLVPALTEMLYVIGAGSQLVAVSSYDDYPPDTKTLPRVGALLDPDVERILSLRPDLVMTYGSQGSLEAQLARAGIRVFSYRHGGLEAIFGTMRTLGAATGRTAGAERASAELRRQLDAVRARVRGRARPRTLLVFGRQPGSLQQIYVSGGRGFLHEMLEIAGGANVFGDVMRESVQPSQETLLARAPEVILELRSRGPDEADVGRERDAWLALASVPAVRQGRIHFLAGEYLTVPGPRVGAATETIARALHPDAFR